MQLLELIQSRRTIHKYLPEPVPQPVIDNMLLAAHHAPNHKLTWPWHFLQVGLETRTKLASIAVVLKAEDRDLSEAMQATIRGKILNPGALVVATQRRDDNLFRSKEDYAATCCAVQNMLLMAHAEGFGAKWSTGALTTHADTYRVLRVDERKFEIIGFIWVGVPAQIPTIPRPNVEDFVRKLP